METEPSNINYNYLLISIVILIFVYSMLENMKTKIYADQSNYKMILVETDKGITKTNTNMVKFHLINIKNFLLDSCRNNSKVNCPEMIKLILDTNIDLATFLSANNIKFNSFNDNAFSLDIYGEYDTPESNEINKSLIDIVIKIDQICYMLDSIKSNKPVASILKLNNLHMLVSNMNNNICNKSDLGNHIEYSISKNSMSMEELNNMEDEISLKDSVLNNSAIGEMESFGMVPNGGRSLFNQRAQSNNCSFSQENNLELARDSEERNTFCNEDYSMVRECNLLNLSDKTKKARNYRNKSFNMNDSISNNDIFNGSKYALSKSYKQEDTYKPWYNIDKLKNERGKLLNLTSEVGCKRSLRKDYGELENDYINMYQEE